MKGPNMFLTGLKAGNFGVFLCLREIREEAQEMGWSSPCVADWA